MAQNNKSGNSNSQLGSPLDADLINRKSSADKAGELKEAQRDKQTGGGNNEQTEEPATIREQQLAAKREAALSEETKKKKEDKSSSSNPVNKATSNLLKNAWLNIIPSFGLTLIWINIHVFLGAVFSEKLFCKLGMEWVNTNIKQAQSAEAKKIGKVAGTFEGAGLACLDLGCLMLIIVIFMILGLIFDIFTLEGLSRIAGWFWNKLGFTK